MSVIGVTARRAISPGTWRRLWDRLGDLEAALATTEGELQGKRIAQLEADVVALRHHAGLPPRAIAETTAAAPRRS